MNKIERAKSVVNSLPLSKVWGLWVKEFKAGNIIPWTLGEYLKELEEGGEAEFGSSESEIREGFLDSIENLEEEDLDVVISYGIKKESLKLDKNSQASDVAGELETIENNTKDLTQKNKAKRLKNSFKNKKVGDKLSNSEREKVEDVIFKNKGESSLNTTMNESKNLSELRQFIAKVATNELAGGMEELEKVVKDKIDARYEKIVAESEEQSSLD